MRQKSRKLKAAVAALVLSVALLAQPLTARSEEHTSELQSQR